MTHRGFTLIELLVVVSIIAILAAMLLPAIGLVRASARTVVCASNLRQVGIAMVTYSQDWDGLLPPFQSSDNWGDGPGQWPIWGVWCGTIRDVLPHGRVYLCPEAPLVRKGSFIWAAADTGDWGSQKDIMCSSYGVAQGFQKTGWTLLDAAGFRYANDPQKVRSKSCTIYLSEAMRVNIDGSGCTDGQIDYPFITGGPVDPAKPRGAGWNWATWRVSHKQKANAVFYDLRVQTVGWDDSNPTHSDQGPGNMWNGRWDAQW